MSPDRPTDPRAPEPGAHDPGAHDKGLGDSAARLRSSAHPDVDEGASAEHRPGVFAWVVIAIGWVAIVVAVLGAVTDDNLRGEPSNWLIWLFGGAVIHDALLLPLLVLVGWLLTRLLAPTWRTPLRTALIVAAVLTLTIWPIARRYGARDDNPSILPLPVGRNLALVVAGVLLVGLAVGAVATIRRRADSRASGTSDTAPAGIPPTGTSAGNHGGAPEVPR